MGMKMTMGMVNIWDQRLTLFCCRLIPSQAREYVESLHQNLKDVLVYGKNNVKVQPQGRDLILSGYLSLHQITKDRYIAWYTLYIM